MFLPALRERKLKEFDIKGHEPDAEWKDEWIRNKEGMMLLLLPCVHITCIH
jgi:hypothetical protein